MGHSRKKCYFFGHECEKCYFLGQNEEIVQMTFLLFILFLLRQDSCLFQHIRYPVYRNDMQGLSGFLRHIHQIILIFFFYCRETAQRIQTIFQFSKYSDKKYIFHLLNLKLSEIFTIYQKYLTSSPSLYTTISTRPPSLWRSQSAGKCRLPAAIPHDVPAGRSAPDPRQGSDQHF